MSFVCLSGECAEGSRGVAGVVLCVCREGQDGRDARGGDFGAVYRRQRLQRAVPGDGVRAVLAAAVEGGGRTMCSAACRCWRSR